MGGRNPTPHEPVEKRRRGATGCYAAWRLSTITILLALTGCGYTTRGLYPDHVRTVAVPIFTSEGLRRDAEFLLTQKVQQAIEARTPYKVVGENGADTVLRGHISSYYKTSFGEDGNDNPRGGMMVYQVKVTWLDCHSGQTLGEQTYAIDKEATFNTLEAFTINLAQSKATADSDAMDRLAQQVVNLMETPW